MRRVVVGLVAALNRLTRVVGYPDEASTREAAREDGACGQGEVLLKLAEVSRRLITETDLECLLGEIAGTAQRLTGAKYAALGIFDQSGTRLARLLAAGIDEAGRQAIGMLPSGRGLLGHLVHREGPLRLKDLTEHPAFLGFPPHHPPMRSFLGISIRVRGRPYGRLYLTDKQGGEEFTERDEHVITALAAHAGIAIENAAMLNTLRESEAALRDSQQRLQAILDNSTAVIFLKDIDGRYQLINRRFETLFHVSKETIIGKTDYDLFPKDKADVLRTNDHRVLRDGTTVEVEEVIPHDDGLHTYISIKFPLHDADSVPCGVCGIATDITERKRTEVRLEHANDSLRTATQELEEMTSVVAHDLKSPLVTIQGYVGRLETMGAGSLEEKGRRYLRTIREVSGVLAQMVDGLLDVARIHCREFRPQPCALATVVDRALDGLGEHVTAVGASFVFELDPALPRVLADSTALYEVYSNLIGNALKFVASGRPPSVRIGSEARGAHALLWVRDNGIGIPPDRVGEVFQMFRKLDRKTPGVGVGLAAVKKLIHQTGGQVWIESRPDEGTTVFFTCPLP